jgi:hypothetical protein
MRLIGLAVVLAVTLLGPLAAGAQQAGRFRESAGSSRHNLASPMTTFAGRCRNWAIWRERPSRSTSAGLMVS